MPKFSTVVSPCLTVDVNYVDDDKLVIHALYKNEHYYTKYENRKVNNEETYNRLKYAKFSVLELGGQAIELMSLRHSWKLPKKNIVALKDGDLTFEYDLVEEKLAVKYKNSILEEVNDCYDLSYNQYELLEEYEYDYSDNYNGCVVVVFLDFAFYYVAMPRLEFDRNGVEYDVYYRNGKLIISAVDEYYSYSGEAKYSGKLYYQLCREVKNNTIDIVEMRNKTAIIIFINGSNIILKKCCDETLSGSRSEAEYVDDGSSIESDEDLHTQIEYDSDSEYDPEDSSDYVPEDDYEDGPEDSSDETVESMVKCIHSHMHHLKESMENQSADINMTNLEIHENNMVTNNKLNELSDTLNKQQQQIRENQMYLQDLVNSQLYMNENIKSFMLMMLLFLFLLF